MFSWSRRTIAVIDSNGADDTVELNLTKPQFDKMMASAGLVPDRTIPLVSQASQLRIVVRDDASGSLGSVTVPLKSVPQQHRP